VVACGLQNLDIEWLKIQQHGLKIQRDEFEQGVPGQQAWVVVVASGLLQ
jgi:hypothetical protein